MRLNDNTIFDNEPSFKITSKDMYKVLKHIRKKNDDKSLELAIGTCGQHLLTVLQNNMHCTCILYTINFKMSTPKTYLRFCYAIMVFESYVILNKTKQK